MGYSSVTQRAPDADPVAARQELQRIVASPAFEDADRLVRFLDFVVEETLAGRGGLLKESVIGVEVFGRDPGYDPKTDPIVRVQARRLRAKLDNWYQAGGRTSAVRIALPKGGYAPEFGPPPEPEAARTGARSRAAAFRLLAAMSRPSAIRGGRGDPDQSENQAGRAGIAAVYGLSRLPDQSRFFARWDYAGVLLGRSGQRQRGDLRAAAGCRRTAQADHFSASAERNPVWLPDGRHIGFLRDDGADRFAVMVVPVSGRGRTARRGNPGESRGAAAHRVVARREEDLRDGSDRGRASRRRL